MSNESRETPSAEDAFADRAMENHRRHTEALRRQVHEARAERELADEIHAEMARDQDGGA